MTQKGVVLFTTVMMLSILMLMILSLMQAVFLYVKASKQIVDWHQQFYQLEAFTNQLRVSPHLAGNEDCRVKNKSPNAVIDLLQKQHGCKAVLENQTYIYLIDDLGEYPCLHIMNNHGVRSSHHWLVSVARLGPPVEILQLREARSIDLMTCDDNTVNVIHEGVLSWRHVYKANHVVHISGQIW